MFKELFSSAAIAVMATAMVVPTAAPSQAAQALPSDNPCAGVFNATGSSRKACAPKDPCAAKNPCAAQNPCAAKNPCKAKRPCNPCGAKKK